MTVLLPFQKEDVARMHELKGRVLLASEPGSGKTLETLTLIKEMKPRLTVVTCPKAVKLHWQREAMLHYKMPVQLLSSTNLSLAKTLSREGIIVLNHDILKAWLPVLRGMKPDMVVADECHAFQSMKTQRTKAFRLLCQGVSKVICISGTPLTNKPWELFPVLNILCPQEFCSPFAFGHRFCDATMIFGHWVFNGAKHLKELHQKLTQLCMIRRTKAEVLKFLPPIRQSVLPLELPNRREYDKASGDVIAWLSEKDMGAAQRAARAEGFTRFGVLKRLAARLKLPLVMDWVDDFLIESEGKLLLGVIHKDVVATLYKRYSKLCSVIDGSKTDRKVVEDDGTLHITIGQVRGCFICNQDITRVEWNREARPILKALGFKFADLNR